MTKAGPGRFALAAGTASLVLVMSGCGGTDQPKTSGPASSAPSPSASSASPTPTQSASAEPVSRFEDDPAVQGARAWASAIMVDENAKDTSYSHSAPLSTAHGRTRLGAYLDSDIQAGLQNPGPLPFTPVKVRKVGQTTYVDSCAWTKGWGVDPTTGQPGKKVIQPVSFAMQEAAGQWKLDAFYSSAKVSCGGVTVQGLAF